MMFRSNQGLVIALCAALFIFCFGFSLESQAQTYTPYPSSSPSSYYRRPDRMLEPDEFLKMAKQSNSDSVLQHYEKLLKRNHSTSGLPTHYTIEQIPSPATSNHQDLPSTAVGKKQDLHRKYANPGFSLATPPKPNSNPKSRTSQSTKRLDHSLRAPTSAAIERKPRTPSGFARRNNAKIRRISAEPVGKDDRFRSGQSRARIVSYNQDVAPDRTQGSDAFAEPPADILATEVDSRQDNPFADPPPDVMQDQRLQDPFDQPPADMQSGDQNQNAPKDPFGGPVEEPNNLPPETQTPPAQEPFQGVDPFPNTPGDLERRNQQVPNRQPEMTDPETAPRRPPSDQSDSAEPNRPSQFKTGPYRSFNGYQPKPIRPAPPERDYPIYSQQVMPPYDYPVDAQMSQPSLFHDNFDTSQLYEGITYDADARLASYECDTCNGSAVNHSLPLFASIKSRIARFTRLGAYDYQTCDAPCASCDNRLLNTQQFYSGRPLMGALQMNRCGGCGTCQDCSNSWRGPMVSMDESVIPEQFESADYCCEPMFYYALFGGYTSVDDLTDLGVSPLSGTLDATMGTVTQSDGFGFGVSLGQWQGQNLRSEIEYVFRSNDFDSIIRNNNSSVAIDGSLESHAGMFNLYWDFNRMLFGCRPYFGAGIGFAFFDYNASTTVNGTNDDDSSFAHQWMLGVSRPYSVCSDWFVEYRQFYGDSFGINVAEFSDNVRYRADNVFFGFRKRF